ncbi:MBL fold metallo-hydrolase [Lentisalinibacter sediminis]|uniref:MBL fold metallo-hydrolase n=1 Tax=Lentisalinibacter sediminis TaxID=2992237 RepID=UPI003870A174
MFIEKVKSHGLAHLSYLIGSDGKAAVIDPRRDCSVYIEMAAAQNCRVTHIFETHRNEDLLSGAAILAERTGAGVYHGPNADGDVAYAETVKEGARFDIGQLRLDVMETPGHTDDSVSYAVYDTDFGDEAVAVFTGDALFIGDVGRTDFYPDRAEEVAGLLFDSLRKLIALGDQAVIYPAHGAGSVCGSGMADREVSTIGYERINNPRLAIDDRDSFVKAKLAEHHEYPPYFRHMEALNLRGASAVPQPLLPMPLTSEALKTSRDDAVVVDVRSASGFLGAHLPGSLALPADTIAAYAGWLLEPRQRLVLVADDAAQAESAARHFARIGYDNLEGFLAPSLAAWAASGECFTAVPVVDADIVRKRLDAGNDDWTLLDVRALDEVKSAEIPDAKHIYLGKLPDALDELDRKRRYTVMCGSGTRATIAASLLLRAGFDEVDLFLGSMGAWTSEGFPIDDAG